MVILATLGILAIGLTATSTMTPMTVQAAGGPSGCPDPGHCTCNAATGVMHDDLMAVLNQEHSNKSAYLDPSLVLSGWSLFLI